MRLNAQTAKSLIGLAIILLLIGAMVGVPVARMFAWGLACFCAVLPALFCLGRLRFVAVLTVLLAGYAAVTTYLDGDPAYDAYVERARSKAAAGSGETKAPSP